MSKPNTMDDKGKHRHSSPCDIHKGECVNPYHIHDTMDDLRVEITNADQ